MAKTGQYLCAEFYTPPEPLPPGGPSDLIRTEPSRLVLEPSGQLGAVHALPLLVDGESAMYRIADRFNGVPTPPSCWTY